MARLTRNANGTNYCEDCRKIVILFDDDVHACDMTVDMAGIGETWTLPNVPTTLAPLVRELNESGILNYGPSYSRQAAEAVRDASRFLEWGDWDAAETYLLRARDRIKQD